MCVFLVVPSLQGRINLHHLSALPEAANLVVGACASAPDSRPPVAALLAHPLWWRPPTRLAFLIDFSDRMELEDRAVGGRSRGRVLSCADLWAFNSLQLLGCRPTTL